MNIIEENIGRIYANQASRNADYRMPSPHSHMYFEFYYVRSGSAGLYFSGSADKLEAGDFALIPPGIQHYVHYSASCIRMNCYFNFDEFMDGTSPFCPLVIKPDRIVTGRIPEGYRPELEHTLERIIAEGRLYDDFSTEYMKLLLRQMALLILRCRTKISEEAAESAATPIKQAEIFISEHYASDITLPALAEHVGLSPSYLSRRFKQETGIGIKEFINTTRLEKAEKELLCTDHRISDVASNNGFSDANYFKDCFRKAYGCSPREYRKTRIENNIRERVPDISR